MGMGSLTSLGIGERTNGFSRDFVDFLSGRSDRLSKREFALASVGYSNTCQNLKLLLKKVNDNLGEDMHEELDEVVNDIIGMSIFMAYKAGFSDGIKMIVHSLGG